METLDRSGLVRLKDWTKFAHPISIILGSKTNTYSYSIPEDQQKLIFTQRGDAIGNGYPPQYIVWSSVHDAFGPVGVNDFPTLIFNLQRVVSAGNRVLLYYTTNYYSTTNNNMYIITAIVRKLSATNSQVTFMMHGTLTKLI